MRALLNDDTLTQPLRTTNTSHANYCAATVASTKDDTTHIATGRADDISL
jgi:hypothetical protein